MSIEAQRKLNQLVNTVGGAAAHFLFPTDLDTYYAMSLELVNSELDTVDYFVFPVMPSDYSSTYRSLANVRKTAGGTLSIKGSGFTPKQITISGDFGRNFRFTVGQNQVSAKSWKFSTGGGDYTGGLLQVKTTDFIVGIKSGYGSNKVLQAILFKANQLDDRGRPYSLYFYNPSLGESYLVEVQEHTIMQNVSKSRVWTYRFSLNALDFVGREFKLLKLIGAESVTRGLDIVTTAVRDVII